MICLEKTLIINPVHKKNRIFYLPKIMPILQTKKGFTLVEVLLATFILSVGIVSTLLFFSTAMTTADYSRDVTISTSHGEYIFEEMKTQNSIANIVSTDWNVWLTNKGLTLLPQEQVQVDISDILKNSAKIKLIISWVKRSRVNKTILYTEITK